MSSSSTSKNEKPIVEFKSVEIPKNVAIKFYLHTILMFILPLSTYYLTLNYLFEGKDTTKAALSAAGIANLIVFSYILTAIFEKDSGAEQQQQKRKDD